MNHQINTDTNPVADQATAPSALSSYNVPELTSEQHTYLIAALQTASDCCRGEIGNDPAFGELMEAGISFQAMFENPRLLPEETEDGRDTADIVGLLWDVRAFDELCDLLKALEPQHCRETKGEL